MKKSALALFMAAVMAVSATPVLADDGFVWEAVVDKTEVQVGETFTLDLDVLSNPGIQNVTVDIKYNSAVVKPIATVEPADDLVSYTSSNGYDVPLISTSFVDNVIANMDISQGYVPVVGLTYEPDESGNLKATENTGTLARVSFQAIAEGDAGLDLGSRRQIGSTPRLDQDYGYAIDFPQVTVSGGSATATTEATTKAATIYGSDSSSDSDTSTSTTTTSATTEATTEATTVSADKATETTTAAPIDPSAAFSDLENYPWAADYISSLAAQGIVNGYSDGTFKPANDVKRADFIIMLLRAMDVDTSQTPSDNFSDVRSDKYYYNAIGIAKKMGIASGSNDGTFSPESNITRQDMMILAKKAVELQSETTLEGDVSVLDKFADKDNISAYAEESLAAMVDAGIVSGTGSNIQPKDNTTRAQSAVIVSKILDLMK